MKTITSEHVVYINCFECQTKKLFMYTTCAVCWPCSFHVLKNWLINEQYFVIFWVSWCKNKCFWQRFTCTYVTLRKHLCLTYSYITGSMYSNENEYVPYATYLQLPIFFLFFSFQTEKSKKKFWNLDRKKNIYLPFVHTKNIIFLHFIGKPQVGRKNLYGRELFFCKIIVFCRPVCRKAPVQ